MKSKKAFLGDLKPAVIILGTAIIVIAIVLAILSQTETTFTPDTAEYNATVKGVTAMGKFMDWMPILVIIVVAVIILGLIGAFGGEKRR